MGGSLREVIGIASPPYSRAYIFLKKLILKIFE